MNTSTGTSDCLNVLVVEDNADMAHVITGILHAKGCSTIVTNNCEDAFSLIQTNVLDVVSCDIRLSGTLTGLDLARMVRGDSQLAHLFLIAISGLKGEHEKKAALTAGFDMFFPKPVKFADLTKALDAVSKNRRSSASPVLQHSTKSQQGST
jgi:CheY-like chemotaxis protein